LIERDNFRKLNDYAVFNRCTDLLTVDDLEELSKNKFCEERFLNFMRYVSMMKEDDPKRTNGQRLIDKIFEIERFKGYKGQNVSL
jgi:predicted nucleotidyltransferase